MKTVDKKIPGQEANKNSIKDSAIDKKSNESNGLEINDQVQDKKKQHQPRDNA